MNNPVEVQYAIESKQLTKCYGDDAVVRCLDLAIPVGSVYGFLGRNGAGKSTTIKMLMGLVQPTSGSYSLLGTPDSELNPELRTRIAYIAEGHPLYNWMTVREAVRFAKQFYSKWNDRLVEQILEHFEVPQKKRLGRLSNGQRAQVSLAIAVAPDPELLILDDPTLGLDTVVRRDFLESLIQIIQRKDRTILFSTHILADVERVADRIGVMQKGVLRVDCPADYFRQSLRKILVEFRDENQSLPEIPGAVYNRRLGSRCEMLVVDFTDELHQQFESLDPLHLEVTELNLEDAFIEYTRGSRRMMPVFAEM